MASPDSVFFLPAFSLVLPPAPRPVSTSILPCAGPRQFFINQCYSQHTEGNPTSPFYPLMVPMLPIYSGVLVFSCFHVD
ncbi:hypothetical protein ACRRTK_015089 [Alexandromys fortis]